MIFTSPDTLIPDPYIPMDWNRYLYARGNPIRYTDPSGHMVSDGMGGGCGYKTCSYHPSTDLEAFSQPPSYSNRVANGNAINSSSYYLPYWPWLMFPQKGPCLGKLGCWGGVEYASFAVRTNRLLFDKVGQEFFTDSVILWGFNGSTSVPSIYHTGGLEEVVLLKDGTRATYNYGGHGSAVGAGANAAAYGGLAVNVKTPEDYRGISASAGITISIFDIGITVSYFWNGDYAPLTPGVVQGVQLGYAPGAEVSAWFSNVLYRMNWSSQ